VPAGVPSMAEQSWSAQDTRLPVNASSLPAFTAMRCYAGHTQNCASNYAAFSSGCDGELNAQGNSHA
jgi:hypothetical protein